ncbi:GNAT family N-acetyltransferase [Microbacterium marinilacus]|uniref:N-acetyltransferase domain-containing protein n=1 Tax=Microbacterium marinilacus TaxID=415209 RepID=A0ABP7B3S6_9MICO|nr:GNAT family N-acetyltransferase [Microbacterium marinilacus]MBY0688531.1 GNAT family N-acetyltransferase [Microbacterium marinilacus]
MRGAHAATDPVVLGDLVLTPVDVGDLPETHRLHADPAVWTHLPSGRHTSLARTREMIEHYIADWDHGLGYWTARLRDTGAYVGIGGCRVREDAAWNVYYRLDPAFQGRGFATRIARAGAERAAAVRPELPVSAILLEHNLASKAVAERLGLRLVWRGPDDGNPDPGAVRLIYTDRDVTPAQLVVLRG